MVLWRGILYKCRLPIRKCHQYRSRMLNKVAAVALTAGQQRFRLADLSDYAGQRPVGLVPWQLPLISHPLEGCWSLFCFGKWVERLEDKDRNSCRPGNRYTTRSCHAVPLVTCRFTLPFRPDHIPQLVQTH